MRILCVSTLRNEGPFVLEWIAHLRAAGVTDFLLFSNDCEDGTDAILDALAPFGVVHVPQSLAADQSPQWQALNAAWAHPLRHACDWALVIDVDEFPNIAPATLPGLIDAMPKGTDAIAMPWRLFGHGGQARFTDAPVTETFTRAIPKDAQFPVAATFFKSLFRIAAFQKFGVHRPRQKPKAPVPAWVDGAGRPLPDHVAANDKRLSLYGLDIGRSLVELNHYSVKSAESFLIKRARGLPNRSEKRVDLAYWVERNFNTTEERAIARMRPATKAILAELIAIPSLSEMHAAAIAWHQAKFDALIAVESEHKLYGQLLMASDSAVLNAKQTAQMVAWYQRVTDKA